MERREQHDAGQLADELEDQADKLAQQGEWLDRKATEVRREWEHKRSDPNVPGADPRSDPSVTDADPPPDPNVPGTDPPDGDASGGEQPAQ